jgi:hypothetical protein
LEALLAVILTWLSTNLSLPMTRELPRVEIASAAKMAEVRYSRVAAHRSDRPAADVAAADPAELTGRVYAIYDDAAKVIYLPQGWSASSPADVSMLVHELVHHVQNVHRMQFDCPAGREKPAYRAQARWLELFDKTLTDEFGLDPMTLLVRTNCMR